MGSNPMLRPTPMTNSTYVIKYTHNNENILEYGKNMAESLPREGETVIFPAQVGTDTYVVTNVKHIHPDYTKDSYTRDQDTFKTIEIQVVKS